MGCGYLTPISLDRRQLGPVYLVGFDITVRNIYELRRLSSFHNMLCDSLSSVSVVGWLITSARKLHKQLPPRHHALSLAPPSRYSQPFALVEFPNSYSPTMVVDRRLDNVLRALLQPGQADPNSPAGSRVYASATNVLATLTNPLNVSLLSTQLLVSPAIWGSADGLRAALRTFGVFQSATLAKIETPGLILAVEDWLNALVRGANQNGWSFARADRRESRG